MNKNYYYLHMVENNSGGIAYSPKNIDLIYVDDLNNLKQVPFIFSLKDGLLQDYLYNDLGWPIFSEKFKNLISPFLTNLNTQWITAKVKNEQEIEYTTYILKFNKKPDILDENKTIFGSNHSIVKSVLLRKKVKDLDVFLVPDSDFQIIVSEDVKLKIEHNNLTGMEFSKVPIS